jgi:putative N6-adenine-specific DNA methylase
VVVRIGRFHASTFQELERRAKSVPWVDYLPASGTVSVRVTCRKSRLYHSDAVAERILGAIARAAPPGIEVRAQRVEESDDDNDEEKSAQLFVVRMLHDECQISADSSGELLHRRGYRQEIGKAPLRETLAAAMVLASRWKPGEPLLDPLCGSGTIPIEAALIARNIAPGLYRNFQFMQWPSFESADWSRSVQSAREAERKFEGRVLGSDRDQGAVGAAKRNAERARVADSTDFVKDSLSAAMEKMDAETGGWILTNPPYGVRVGDVSDLRNLYAALGEGVRRSEGWRAGILSADLGLARQLKLPFRERFSTRNGGIPVTFVMTGAAEKETLVTGVV